jgi:hypothetical protein
LRLLVVLALALGLPLVHGIGRVWRQRWGPWPLPLRRRLVIWRPRTQFLRVRLPRRCAGGSGELALVKRLLLMPFPLFQQPFSMASTDSVDVREGWRNACFAGLAPARPAGQDGREQLVAL